MKFDKIVGFGDSWIWGDELLDPALEDHPQRHPVLMENTSYREGHCFLGRLGENYKVPTENFGWPGGSLQSTIWTYLWWIEHETVPLDRCLVMIGLTDGNRTSFYNPNHVSYGNDPPWNRFQHSAWVHSGASSVDDDWADMVKRYMVLTDCPQLIKLNYMQAAYFFDGQIKRHAGLVQFNTMRPECEIELDSLLWPRSGLQLDFRDMPDRGKFLKEMGHPNELGHKLIADRLIAEIDRVILTE